MAIFQKDLVSENNHPLNLVDGKGIDEASVTRPPIFEVFMRMAEELAKRSTCARLRVGTVITDPHLENVVAIGYNGNARRFPNECDGPDPGAWRLHPFGAKCPRKGPRKQDGQGGFRDREPMRDLRQIAHPGQHLACVLP